MSPQTAYRPQWLYPTPPGYREDVFQYAFNSSNTPGLSTSIAAGKLRENIPLVLEAGSEFCWRAYSVYFPNQPQSWWIRFKDPFGNYLSSDYLPLWLYGCDSCLLWGIGGVVTTTRIVIPVEPEIICPSGSMISVDLKNLAFNATKILQSVTIVLYGLKRVPK